APVRGVPSGQPLRDERARAEREVQRRLPDHHVGPVHAADVARRAPHGGEPAEGGPQARGGAPAQPALPQPLPPRAPGAAAAPQARAGAPLLRRPPGGLRRHLRVGAALPRGLRAAPAADGPPLPRVCRAADRLRARPQPVARTRPGEGAPDSGLHGPVSRVVLARHTLPQPRTTPMKTNDPAANGRVPPGGPAPPAGDGFDAEGGLPTLEPAPARPAADAAPSSRPQVALQRLLETGQATIGVVGLGY